MNFLIIIVPLPLILLSIIILRSIIKSIRVLLRANRTTRSIRVIVIHLRCVIIITYLSSSSSSSSSSSA